MHEIDTHTLLVVANPDPDSLTHHLANEVRVALSSRGTVDVADLSREGFDPRWTTGDRFAYQGRGAPPADVTAEQHRLDRATDLVLVFSVYWWSMPSILKGWIDRVFVNGWAFEHTPAEGLVPRLQWLTTHVLPVAASDADVFKRHGYEQAIRTQIEHGLIDFCGSVRGTVAFVYDSEDQSESTRRLHVSRAVHAVTASVAQRKRPSASSNGNADVQPAHSP